MMIFFRNSIRRFSTVSERNFKVWSNESCVSPISVLFLSTPFDNIRSQCWNPLIAHCLSAGHEVGMLNIFDENLNLHRKLELISSGISKLGPQTMVLAPSIAGFYAQKLLESYQVKGLFLINSFPPNSQTTLLKIVNDQVKSTHKELDLNILKTEFGYSGRLQSLIQQDNVVLPFFPSHLFADEDKYSWLMADIRCPSITDIMEVYSNPVHLEKRVVPIYLLSSAGDGVVSEVDKVDTILFHGIRDENTSELVSNSHVFWLHDKEAINFTISKLSYFLSKF